MRFKNSSLLVLCVIWTSSYPIFEGSQYFNLPGQAVLEITFYDCLNLTIKARRSFRKSVTVHQFTRRNVPDDLNISTIAVRASYLAMWESRCYCSAQLEHQCQTSSRKALHVTWPSRWLRLKPVALITFNLASPTAPRFSWPSYRVKGEYSS
jgi:hypothetical protein